MDERSPTGKRAILIIVILMGVLALILQVFSVGLGILFDAVFGDMWMSRVRHGLIDVGISSDFVCRYVAFVLLHVPTWCLLLVAVLYLGFSSWGRSGIAAVSLVLWLPIMDFVIVVWWVVYMHSLGVRYARVMDLLFGFNTRIVPAVITIMVGLIAWSVGRLLNRLIRKSTKQDAEQLAAADGE